VARVTGDAARQAYAVSAHAVYRFYRTGDDETLALRGVSLDVAPGELVALVGPSGSGKSTLLSCLAGLDEPDGGTVSIRGRRMSHRPEAARARMRAEHIGFVAASANLFDHLSVGANVELVRCLTPRHPRRSVDEVLDAVGLRARARAYPGELSGGESARAALAVALAVDPAVVLADEPTGELDSTTEGEILALLRETAAGDVAVVVASHSPALAAVADRVLALRDGEVQA
jgi:putative ABC transport system ATP-binding protein